MTRHTPRVCVGVPVWRGAQHLAETLESVLRQRGVALTTVVSVDDADEASVAACRPFLTDPRVSLLVQPRRLGWVGNSSAALTAAASTHADYACLQPHDDVLEDDYLGELVAAAEANSGAAVVYSDIKPFGGAHDAVIRQPTVAGSPFERQMRIMLEQYNAVAYRGLMRVSTLRSILPMAGNPCDDFAADTVWMARQALVGDLVRVPRPLYRKRYHAGNTHAHWGDWPYEVRMTAWISHCVDMLAQALKASNTPAEHRLLHRAARTRLVYPRESPYRTDLLAMNRAARGRMESRFDAIVAVRPDIGPVPSRALMAHLWAVRAIKRIASRGS